MSLAKPPHQRHHGNLRNALIEAGISLLEEGGVEALTLRKCAARAGVSHAAPAHHFDGIKGLKAAIAEEAFARFAIYMRRAAEAEGPSHQDRLRGICRGYLQFGLEYSALLETMFGVDAEHLELGLAGPDETDAYSVLREACAPFVPDGIPREVIEIQVWSLIHGYTLLMISGRLGKSPADLGPEGPFEQIMSLLEHIGTAPSS